MNAPTPDRFSDEEALALADASPAEIRRLCAEAALSRDAAWGKTLTYSPKVFLPVTNLCRNRCDYCAFRRSPGDPGEWTMSPDEIGETLTLARARGAVEALFCLGDTPETAFASHGRTLASFGHASTVDYLVWAGRRALDLGLLPHTNAGILSAEDMLRLKAVNVSLGLMLENVSSRLCEPGMPHRRAPDKRPARRLRMLEDAGRLRIPFTTGILVGIGETRRERIEALLAIRDLHRKHGHVQEIIVQNFVPHAETPMHGEGGPSDDDIAQGVAMARLLLPDDVSVQVPPNLNAERTLLLVRSGINDFGGISPLTPDYINPDRPWPFVDALARVVRASGFELAPRLPIYDGFLGRAGFLEPSLEGPVHRERARLAARDRGASPGRAGTEAFP